MKPPLLEDRGPNEPTEGFTLFIARDLEEQIVKPKETETGILLSEWNARSVLTIIDRAYVIGGRVRP